MNRKCIAQACLLLGTFFSLGLRSTADVTVDCGGDQDESLVETSQDTVCSDLTTSHRRSLHDLEVLVLADYPDVHCNNGDCAPNTCVASVVFIATVSYTDHYNAVLDCYTSDAKVNGKILIHCSTCTVM